MRPTTTHTIGSHKVEIYEFATPRDIHAVRDQDGETKQTEMLLERLVVSLDESKNKIVDTVMDSFTLAEYTELQEIIASIIDPKKKSDNQSSTTVTNE